MNLQDTDAYVFDIRDVLGKPRSEIKDIDILAGTSFCKIYLMESTAEMERRGLLKGEILKSGMVSEDDVKQKYGNLSDKDVISGYELLKALTPLMIEERKKLIAEENN